MMYTKDDLQKNAYTKDGCYKRKMSKVQKIKYRGVAKAAPFFHVIESASLFYRIVVILA